MATATSATETRRRLVIDFEDTESDFLFSRRITDLRERYPTWRISAVTSAPLIARPPPSGGDASTSVMKYVRGLEAELEEAGPSDDAVDLTQPAPSDTAGDAGGNVVGEAPQNLREGLRVRCLTPPFTAREGRVVSWRGSSVRVGVYRPNVVGIQILLGTRGVSSVDDTEPYIMDEWWYDRGDLRVIPEHCQCYASEHYATVRDGLIAAAKELGKLRLPLPAAVIDALQQL